ncbi:MAG: hypothetical protein AAF596_11150, partial [Planctomycetota bacterium]
MKRILGPAAPVATLVATLLFVSQPAAAQTSGEDDRREALFRSWDKNGDGTLTEAEAPERFQFVLRAAAKRVGGSAVSGVTIDDLLNRPQPSDAASNVAGSSRGVGGFGVSTDRSKPAGFGAGVSTAATASPRSSTASSSERPASSESSYARSWIKRYDRNGNGQVERDEWPASSGDLKKRDLNRDGVITAIEMTSWLEQSRTSSKSTSGSKSASRSSSRSDRRSWSSSRSGTPLVGTRSSGKPGAGGDADGSRKSYRFTPATERLPSGLPSWF